MVEWIGTLWAESSWRVGCHLWPERSVTFDPFLDACSLGLHCCRGAHMLPSRSRKQPGAEGKQASENFRGMFLEEHFRGTVSRRNASWVFLKGEPFRNIASLE